MGHFLDVYADPSVNFVAQDPMVMLQEKIKMSFLICSQLVKVRF